MSKNEVNSGQTKPDKETTTWFATIKLREENNSTYMTTSDGEEFELKGYRKEAGLCVKVAEILLDRLDFFSKFSDDFKITLDLSVTL